ncbi:MAG: ATP-binding protein [Sodaliphilus sp.]
MGYFWNSWAGNQSNVKLIVCGSATTWMLENLIDSHGGLHNRITHEMKLFPFTLAETRDYLAHEGFVWDTLTILQCYMATGGVAYYLTLLDPSESLTQNIDRLFFAENGELRREYKRLFSTLFRKPEPYRKIVETLVTCKCGLTRAEISKRLGKAT